jgi:PAS domain S-box-containing protein
MPLRFKIVTAFVAVFLLVFFTVKTAVLLNYVASTPLTRGIEYVTLLAFIPTFIVLIRSYTSKKTDKLLKELQEFDRFVDAAALVSKADADGKITYVNKKFEEVSGWPLAEARGRDHNIVNSGMHDKEFWAGMYKTVIEDKQIWNAIVTNKNKNGELYWVDSYIKAEFDGHDNLSGFMSIRQDVTDLKRKEVEISNRMEAINRSNAVIEFDLNGNIKFANELFLKTLGYSKNVDLIGKHHSIFIEDDEKHTQEYFEFWESLRKGNFFSGEITRKKRDGSLIYLQATYNPIVGADGKPYRVLKIATDVTNTYNQQKEIEKKNTYLEHAAKILRHDMHSGINTYIPRGLSSLERRLKPEDIAALKIEAPLKMIKEGIKHTQKVYKGVYEFTNLVKSDVSLTKAPCNVKTILSDYLSATAYRPQVILDDSLPTISINESLFCTAIDNLIRNGLKYNDSDNKMVKLYVESHRKQFGLRHTYIVVEDNGRGLSQADFDHLSKPYTRKEGQKESGSGLGLNICKAILQEHGYSITAEKLSQGTKLKIKIK